MDLLPSPEQQQIVDSVADFLRDEAPAARLLDRARDHAVAERDLWVRYAELGWFGLGLPEALGGVGYGTPEDALLCREAGRALVSPNLLAARLAAEALARTDQPVVAQAVLEGALPASVANPAGRCRIGPRCTGRFQLMDASPGDLLVAWNDDGLAVLPFSAFQDVQPIRGLDPAVGLAIGLLSDAQTLTWIPAPLAPLPALASAMVAAMSCGVAEAAMAAALEHVKFREQFGRKIGGFQAVKHHCANMALATEAAWAQTVMAALSLDDPAARDFEAAAARTVATQASNLCAALNVQLHGGLGYAAESGAHLFVKRARLLEQLGGPRRLHRDKLMTSPMMA